MNNYIHFTSEKQGSVLRGIEDELRFRQRVLLEAKASFDRAKLQLANTVDAIGAPADGRKTVFMYTEGPLGPPGIYFEDFGNAWNDKLQVFQPRTNAEGIAWAMRMNEAGAKIEIPESASPTG